MPPFTFTVREIAVQLPADVAREVDCRAEALHRARLVEEQRVRELVFCGLAAGALAAREGLEVQPAPEVIRGV